MRSRGDMAPRSRPGSPISASRGSTRRSSASRPPIPSSGTRPTSKTISCHRWRTSRRRCRSCIRSRHALLYSFLFFLSGATGLIYELLWVRVLYQSFGSTIQSVTTVVAAYMGGLGLGAWLLGRRADRSPRPAVLYGWLEIAIGVFGILSPLVLGLANAVYIVTAGPLALRGGASVALRFGLAALVLLIPTTLMGGTLPVLTRALMGEDRGLLKPSLGRLYGLNTLGAMIGTALAGFFLIEFVGVRASLWGTAALNLAIGAAAIQLGCQQDTLEVGHAPAEENLHQPPPTSTALHNLALALLALTAFASLLNEIAWTRVLIMIVGGSTYAFTLILLVFLLGIGLGSIMVARRSAPRIDTAANAALAQGVSGIGAALLFVFFGFLPSYIIAVFQIADLSAAARLLLMGVAVGAVVLVPAIGMGMTFPLLADLTARTREARGSDVGAAYALNTIGSILGAVLTGFVLIVALGTQATLRLGLIVNGIAALALAVLAARGIAEGSAEDRRIRVRVLTGGALGTVVLLAAAAAPGWRTPRLPTVPGITRVKVVEIEPAVLQMDSLFQHVNDSVLARPTVHVVVDDARSALQLDRERYDVIVSEPSNPWVAGIATLYTPEFFRIAKARLAQLLGPGGQLYTLGREWLNLESQDQYFGRMLLGDSGVTRLVARATFDHTDDRPRLEFVAAWRFLDPDAATYAVFDSLVQLGNRDAGTSPFALLRILAARRSDAGVLPYLDAARRAQPDVAEWSVRTAAVRLALGDTAQADSLLGVVIARRGGADALQMRALLAAARSQPLAAAALQGALVAGADTAQIRAAMALVAVRGSRWGDAASQARAALTAAQGTFRHPFPGEFLTQALGQIALNAPPGLADSLLTYAVGRRPGSARYREFAAVAALRAGRCEDAAASFVELLDFALRRDNGPALVRECWAAQDSTARTGAAGRAGGAKRGPETH